MLENLTSEINLQISQIQGSVAADKIPDFKIIHEKLDIFTQELKKLNPDDARKYSALLAVWGDEIRKASDALNGKMNEVRAELDKIQSQNKAIKGYNYLNN